MDLTDAVWRKSSRSGPEGDECVEVAAVWRKSRRSGPLSDNCVEVAGHARLIAARDSKHPQGPHLWLDRPAFARLLDEVKAGRHDCDTRSQQVSE
jgi:hypothetical protein